MSLNIQTCQMFEKFPTSCMPVFILSVALISVFVFALLSSVTGLPSLYSIVEKI